MINLVEIFSEFKDNKHLDRPTLVKVLEDVFRTLIKKKYGSDENFDVIVNTQKGDLELWRVREIVPDGEVADDLSQIAVSEAKLLDQDYEVGEECYQQMQLADFGRRSVMAARQTLVSRIADLEKDEVYKRYRDREGELVTAEVQQVMKRDILVIDESTGNELLLPRTQMIRGDYVRKGDMIRAIIDKVENENGNPRIILSRTSEEFLAKLMEQEVPEIEDGIIVIRKIVRIPGDRAKVAVESYDDRIDPVGACVGMKGSRIHGIVRELRNENIDIVPWTNNETLLIQRTLTPAKVSHVDINAETKRAAVYLDADQVSLAIGRGGSNIKLAGKMTGYEIDVFRKHLPCLETAVGIGVFQDEDTVLALIPLPFHALRIGVAFDHPDAAARVEAHGDGLSQLRLGGDEVHAEALWWRHALQRFLGGKPAAVLILRQMLAVIPL